MSKTSFFKTTKSQKYADSFRKVVLDNTGIDIKLKSRKRHHIFCRRMYYIFMTEMCEKQKESMLSIAKYVGQDHATGLHAIKMYYRDIANDPTLVEEYEYYKTVAIHGKVKKVIATEVDIDQDESIKLINSLRETVKSQREEILKMNLLTVQKSYEIERLNKVISGQKMEYRNLKSEHLEIYNEYKRLKKIEV